MFMVFISFTKHFNIVLSIHIDRKSFSKRIKTTLLPKTKTKDKSELNKDFPTTIEFYLLVNISVAIANTVWQHSLNT